MNSNKHKNVAYKTVVVVIGRSKPNSNCIAPVQYDSHSEFDQNSIPNSGPERPVRRTNTTFLKTLLCPFAEGTTECDKRHDLWKLRILYVEFVNNTVAWHI
jgi:hypothetical protein